jgi:hypothetical protein
MDLAARRRGAYGGEYLRAELHLHARGGRRKAKDQVKLEQENTTKSRNSIGRNSPIRSPDLCVACPLNRAAEPALHASRCLPIESASKAAPRPAARAGPWPAWPCMHAR